MSSKVREVEHTAASQCEYVTTTSYVSKSDEGWYEPADPPTDAAEAALAATPTVRLEEGTTLRVAPMDRKCGGWDYEHFHDKLRLADGCNAGRGMVVTLEGKLSGDAHRVIGGGFIVVLVGRSAARRYEVSFLF